MTRSTRSPSSFTLLAACLVLICAASCGGGSGGDAQAPGDVDADSGGAADAGDAAQGSDAAAVDVAEEDAMLSPTLEPEGYCEATVEAFCGYYLRCGRMAVESVERCREVFLETCNAVYEPQYVTLAEAGLLELSREGVEACEAHLGAVACEQQLFDLDGGCAGMWRGLSPVGGSCGPGIESFVCEEGAACVIGLDFCGECREAAAVGAACGDGVSCEATASCVDGFCVERAAVGAACGDGQPCVLGASCAEGLCQGFEVVALGEPCDRSRRCPYKSECVEGRCEESALLGEACGEAGCASGRCDGGVCVALGDVGAPCGSGAACVSGLCGDGLCVEGPSACIP